MKKIAINGTGISGLTLAWWLRKYGFEPTLFEKASELRNGGYLVDFWGPACEIMKKMGLFDQLKENHIKSKIFTVLMKMAEDHRRLIFLL